MMPTSPQPLVLPDAPAELTGTVKAWSEPVEMTTYLPAVPDRNPMFLEKRVYQGSSGRVYPLPFIDRIATEPERKQWRAIHIENEYVRLMVLPEIGGRIHIGYDKTTGYDFFYRQNAIKPALVGLAGPWVSGGVEFNWPQHHRPATYMPVETEIEEHADGSVTVWSSDHDPMLRMKGMHGLCLHPGSTRVEVKVRLFNRTPLTQTFLWWANVATRVHERYQSFFPTDVRFVADHAKRAITSFPRSEGFYYGVDYGSRGREGVAAEEAPRQFVPDGSYPANDLTWYANIPVPTSYMVAGTAQDFLGGYDHAAGAGLVHVANHHIAPGKKQWTWGNHEFGYAWDRSLTDGDGPYIELMAGVYTDNQPDFSYLAPWETKTFTQTWFPIHGIGVVQAANVDAALSLRVDGATARIGLLVTSAEGPVRVALRQAGEEIAHWEEDAVPARPVLLSAALPAGTAAETVSVEVMRVGQVPLIAYDPAGVEPASAPVVAVEPLPPGQVATLEELYLIGVHLAQYRHAIRQPELYWQEALRRDPEDARTNTAMGMWRLRRAEFEQAAEHFRVAIARLTRLNGNPADGEAFYALGLAERYLGRRAAAYDAFYKATWNAAWRGPAYFALAEMDAAKHDWAKALDHVERSLRAEADNLNARDLRGVALERLGRRDEAAQVHAHTRALDRLDVISRCRAGWMPADGQVALDLAFDLLRCGDTGSACEVLGQVDRAVGDGSGPMVLFTLATVLRRQGEAKAEEACERAAAAALDYCFPVRVEEFLVLEEVVAWHPECAAGHYLLGNFLYDRRRHEEAIAAWQRAAELDPTFPTVQRNLGIGLFNIRGDAAGAGVAFDRALALDPGDARILYERDQLWKRTGVTPAVRLAELRRFPALTAMRDDLSVELATLLNRLDEPEAALRLLLERKFQPWEGGEGLVLGQYVRTRLLLGRAAMAAGRNAEAIEHLHAALAPPGNLSEAAHLLANRSEVYLALGDAYRAAGGADEARLWWERAAAQVGDFQEMAVRTVSETTYWRALAMQRLGRAEEAATVFRSILRYSDELAAVVPAIDYFATSLPAMLLFEDDLAGRNRVAALVLRAQGMSGLGRREEAAALLAEVLALDANRAVASDLAAADRARLDS